jgi:energy-coupling factor transporter ATP-binding protein EcfA2
MPTSQPFPLDRATTLAAAYELCDVGPLYGESLRFYAELGGDRRREAILTLTKRLNLLKAGKFGSLLFTGHRGCGKSTELRKLEKSLGQDYRVIYIEANDQLDVDGAEYTDLYLLLIYKISNELAALRLHFDPTLVQDFQRWFMEITEETEKTVETSMSMEVAIEGSAPIPFISKLIAKIIGQIKGSDRRKQILRDTLQRNISRLRSTINQLLQDAFVQVQAKYPKGFLVIFDNLDRLPPPVADRLYFDHAAQLQNLNCTIIYTVPISVVYSHRNLSNSFERPERIFVVDIYQSDRSQRNLAYDPQAVQSFADVLNRRMDTAQIFDDPALVDRLITASGGHIRQLMTMTAAACLIALTRDRVRVMQDDVTYSIQEEQFNFERVIPSHHYPILAQVFKSKRLEQNENGQQMLFNTSVLEYEGASRWNYINPVIKKIPAFLEALGDVSL